MFHDEPLKAKTEVLTPGEDLSDLGLEQLHARLDLLRGEISRTESMIESKKAGLSAAEAFFNTSASS